MLSGNNKESEISTISSGGLKEMVMIQLNRTILAGSKEMRGGYYSTFTSQNGVEKEVYVEDSREVFSQHVLMLSNLLSKKFDSDNKNKNKDDKDKDYMKSKIKYMNDKIKEIKEKFIKESSPKEEVVLGESFYTNTKDKILLETYREKKLKLFKYLFNEICEFLDKKNYLMMLGVRG